MLLILQASDAESSHAPEFRYLISHCLLQAREVFGEVTVRAAEDWIPGAGERFEAVLLLGSSRILIGAASLRGMRERLQNGAEEVRPYPLTGHPPARPIYTLRGFEQAERAFLGTSPGQLPPLSPVALLSFERFERLAAGRSLQEILLQGDPRAMGAGLYHEFIDYYGEVRSDVLPLMPEGAVEVLEVGCGRGVTGKFLQDRLGCRVTGVELNPVVAAEAAKVLHRVVQGDVQELQLDGRYDVVLGFEVVEHLVETEAFLARLRSLLAPGGRAILSIPNVGHYSIVEDLIAGRWDYLPIGLLCYTHFRFFTRHTLADWLRRSGIERFEIIPQKTEAPERLDLFTAHFEHDAESLATKGFYVLIYG